MTMLSQTRTDFLQAAEDAATSAIAERVGLFGSFLRPDLVRFGTRLLEATSTSARRDVVAQSTLVAAAVQDLIDVLAELSLKALITQFHAYREALGLPLNPDRSYAFDDFEQHLADPAARAIILADHPVLALQMETTVANRLRLLLEVIDHFIDDAEALRAAQLVARPPITKILVSDGGDSHNGGRSVCFLSTPDRELVYKPRSLQAEKLAEEVLALVNPRLDPTATLRLPRTLAAGTHGWQEKIIPKPATSLAAARRYSYRLGAFSSLFAAIGSTDLHCENVMACGEDPMFVDLETFIQCRYRSNGESVELPATPLLTTGLLPFHQPGASIDVDISGTGSGHDQTSRLTSGVLVDKGTDAIRLENQPTILFRSNNTAWLGTDPLDVGDLAGDFDAGILDGANAVRAEATAIKVVLGRGFVIRQVLRPTAVYARFLAAAQHPKYLRDPAERRRLFGLMKPLRHLPKDIRAHIKEFEVAALVRGDIPYFMVSSEGQDLMAPGIGTALGVIFQRPGDEASDAIDHFLHLPQRQHRYFGHTAIVAGAAATTGEDDRPARGDFMSELWSGDPDALASSILDAVAGLALGSSERPAWVLPGLTPHGTVAPMPMATNFHDGGGLLCALVLSKVPEHRKLAVAAIRVGHLDAVAQMSGPLEGSIFSGRPSAAMVAWEFGAAGIEGMAERCHQILATMPASARHPAAPTDVMGGMAGTSAWLASHPALIERHADLISRGVDEMSDELNHGSLPDLEFAHGKLGVAWALARSARAIGDDNAAQIALQHLNRIAKAWVRNSPSNSPHLADASWCKGSTGALIALPEGLLNAGVARCDVQGITEHLIELVTSGLRGRGRDVSPCHGVSGGLQALLHVGRRLASDRYLQLSRTLLAERMARVKEEGYNCGLRRSQGHLGYMTGLTGLAHTITLIDGHVGGIPLALTASSQPALGMGAAR